MTAIRLAKQVIETIGEHVKLISLEDVETYLEEIQQDVDSRLDAVRDELIKKQRK
jgi:hypothetical protein